MEYKFQIICAYCDTLLNMTTVPAPNDILICKYCQGLFFCSIRKIEISELNDEIRAKVECAIQELRHNWIN